jgi:alpha-galactosidase
MPKITIIGGASAFTDSLVRDFLSLDLPSGTLALVDIDKRRLDLAGKSVQKIVQASGKKWKVQASTERRDLLRGTDYLINTIEVSGMQTVQLDNDIPLKYGIDQCIGDTIGPGGLFKAMRTIPVWLEILRDAEKLCPKAQVINYTNPMCMITLAGLRATGMKIVGLCHSVQGTGMGLAKVAGVPYEEMAWECAGINHMAWFTKLEHNGKDLYPVLRKRCQEPEVYERDPVRWDIMNHFGYFVTESSGHFSEYVPYYRKRPDLIKKHCRDGYRGGTSFYRNMWPDSRKNRDNHRKKIIAGTEPITFRRSAEYASVIVEAMETGRPAVVHGNVINAGLIDNLLAGGCVELACLVDRNGLTPTRYGKLPEQVAALCRANMAVFELGVQAALNQDKEAFYHAMMLDPLTAAVLSPGEIRQMTDEMIRAEKKYIPAFLSKKR